MHQFLPSRSFLQKFRAIILNRQMKQLSIETPAPDFQLKDTKGQTHRLADALARGPVALVFYKGECPTCQFTFPYIQKMFSKVGATAGWTLWGISEDDAEETWRFAKQ